LHKQRKGNMSTIKTPDKWVILKIEVPGKEPLQKVFASWSGSFTTGDAWSLNSGITQALLDGDYWDFHGYSGSVYRCHKDAHGTTVYTQGVLMDLIERAKEAGATISVVGEYGDTVAEFNNEI
jgi:hypothetical protein